MMVIRLPRNKVVHKEVYIDALKATEMPFHLTGFRYDCVRSICVIKNKHLLTVTWSCLLVQI